MKTVDAMLCDDIREEINGKHFLIGVYGEAVIINENGSNALMAALLRFRGFENGEHPNTVRVLLNGETLADANGTLLVENEKTVSAYLPRIPLELSEGSLSFEIELSSGEKIHAATYDVILASRFENNHAQFTE